MELEHAVSAFKGEWRAGQLFIVPRRAENIADFRRMTEFQDVEGGADSP